MELRIKKSWTPLTWLQKENEKTHVLEKWFVQVRDIFAQQGIDQAGSVAYCALIALEKFLFHHLSTQILTFSFCEETSVAYLLYFD